MALVNDDENDTLSELHETAKRQLLRKLASSGDGEKAHQWALAYAVLTDNPPNKGRSAYED